LPNVGRQWLVKLESGRHDGAELSKVLAVLDALHIVLNAHSVQDEAAAISPGSSVPVDLDQMLQDLKLTGTTSWTLASRGRGVDRSD
jgi:hypothetical protein